MTYGLLWLRTNDKFFLKSTIVSILLLSVIHIYISISIIDFNSKIFEFLHIITILILILVFLSILLKGIVPVAISCLGIVLLYGSTVMPSIATGSLGPFYYKASIGDLNFEAINRGSHGFFLLGIAMVVFSMIVAYKPHILYTRNRPVSAEKLWDKYPKWDEKLQLAGTTTESLIRLPNLLSDTEKYLLWRYEFILAIIYDTVYQVPTNSYVPESSKILREPKSHKIIGLSKYGYFI
ncbi:MAG TPA: hypothetical protein VIP29_04000 [Nitrososphaeraceae archaeon]